MKMGIQKVVQKCAIRTVVLKTHTQKDLCTFQHLYLDLLIPDLEIELRKAELGFPKLQFSQECLQLGKQFLIWELIMFHNLFQTEP